MRKMSHPLQYMYGLHLALNQLPASTEIVKYFKSAESVLIGSKFFDEFETAVQAANAVVTELVQTLNTLAGADQYVSLSEINPSRTGKKTRSTNWDRRELAKLWILDKTESAKDTIAAVSLTQLYEVEADPVLAS